MTDENRRRLTALVAASTKLAAASRLAKEATIDIAASGLPQRECEYVLKIAVEIDTDIQRLTQRLTSAIEHIP